MNFSKSVKAPLYEKAAFNEMRKIAAENGLSDMTLDEINAEISAVRSGK